MHACPWQMLCLVAVGMLFLAGRAAFAEEHVLFDFEDEGCVRAWSGIDVYALREAEAKAAGAKPAAPVPPEPPVKIEWTSSDATHGKHALKLTFAGGRFPTISATSPLDDWRPFKSFHADVTAGRTCMAIFRAMATTSRYGTSYNDGTSRWEFAARLQPGRNSLVVAAPAYADRLWKDVQNVNIYMYQPHAGESITVDNIRLSTEVPKALSPFDDTRIAVPPGQYKVLGTNLEVRDVNELAEKLKGEWGKPQDQTVEQVEAGVQAEYAKAKQDHPEAVLAMLREGRKGYDPAHPERPFEGWADAGTPSHGPTGLNMACFANAGKREAIETCFRNRPGFLRVDLSCLPQGAQILSARLIVVRAVDMGDRWQKPTMHVAEPCNRPWREYEVNVYEYARDQFWNQYAGMTWGDDGDFSAVLLAHGPTGGKTSSWYFTHAVKYWTDGQHPNHGFILYGVPNVDYLNVYSRECQVVRNRPCLAVTYETRTRGTTDR